MTNMDILEDICVIDKSPTTNETEQTTNESSKSSHTKSTNKSVQEFISNNTQNWKNKSSSQELTKVELNEIESNLKRKRTELEVLVLGDEQELFQKISNEEQQLTKKKYIPPTPAWKDSDDANKVRYMLQLITY